MKLWLHIECGSVFTGKNPPFNCEVCWGREGWRQVTYGACPPARPRRFNRVMRSLINRDGEECANCGITYGLTIDHIRPRSKGGCNALSNLQILCVDCNQRKADTWDEARS